MDWSWRKEIEVGLGLEVVGGWKIEVGDENLNEDNRMLAFGYLRSGGL